MIRLASVNVALPQPFPAKSGESAIDKRPVAGRVAVGREGLGGDAVADRVNHGGPDQALLAYTLADYAWWAGQLDREMPPGKFGENLTLDGAASADFGVGDVLEIGEVRLQVTSPRIPCETLGVRMGDPSFVRAFHRARRPGPYLRVLSGGTIAAGDAVRLVPWDGARVPIADLMEVGAQRRLTGADRARLLAAPIHHKLRDMLEAAE